MNESPVDTNDESTIKAQVQAGMEEAKAFAKSLSLDQIKNGEWFTRLLRQLVSSYNRNARATYFQQKYPGLSNDEIADKLISVANRYSAIGGAVTGAAMTASQLSALATWGMTLSLFLGALGTEIIYLATLQIRLVLDLSVVYDIQLDLDDPEDVLMIFGYALGVIPAGKMGKELNKVSGVMAARTLKSYFSKDTLKSTQHFADRLGYKILQRSIVKSIAPVVSAVVGSSFNYMSTKSVGAIAKAHFKNRGKVTEELRILVSRQNTYDLAFPAAAMYMAQVDGEYSPKERELYQAMLSRMSFEEHNEQEFRRLIASEENILDALAGIDDPEIRHSLIDVLALMAVYDGELSEDEREFLSKAADRLDVPLDMDEIEHKVLDYQQLAQAGILERTREISREAYNKAADLTGQTSEVVRRKASDAAISLGSASQKMKNRLGSIRRRKPGEEEA